MYRARLYGLVVDSDHDLHQRRPVGLDAAVDVYVRDGGSIRVDSEVGPGEPILDHWWENHRTYSAALDSEGFTLRFHGACEFRISADLKYVTAFRDYDADPGIVPILTTGAMLAFQLFMRNQAVLHGSAVQLGTDAVAFVGNSGQGKSTMATLMCADGGRLITDDVLALDVRPSEALCRLGATELRLRKGADELAELFAASEGPARRQSVDKRQVLKLADDADDFTPLRAIVIPRPSHVTPELSVRKVPARDAGFLVLSFLRLSGWEDDQIARRHFAAMVSVAARVPVYIADVPWGPPFDSGMATALRSAVGLER